MLVKECSFQDCVLAWRCLVTFFFAHCAVSTGGYWPLLPLLQLFVHRVFSFNRCVQAVGPQLTLMGVAHLVEQQTDDVIFRSTLSVPTSTWPSMLMGPTTI